MTFEAFETSRYRGEPVDIYLFRFGTEADAFEAYTDAEQPIILSGVTYNPLPIKRASIVSSGSLDKSALDVQLPGSTKIAGLYRIHPPSNKVTLIIRQGHIGDTDNDFKVIFTGRVLQCTRNGFEAKLTCEPISTAMRRTGLRRHYQLGCPHVLYGSECKAVKAAATSTVNVVSFSGNRITLPGGWSGSHSASKYVGGMVEWETNYGVERRTVLRAPSSTVLTLAGPTTDMVAGQEVAVVLGCNHKMGVGPQPDGDCLPLHNNIHNFGGQPWIPTSNPINTNPFS